MFNHNFIYMRDQFTEVMKVVRAKRHAKLKNKTNTNTNPPESMADNQSSTAADDHTVTNQVSNSIINSINAD